MSSSLFSTSRKRCSHCFTYRIHKKFDISTVCCCGCNGKATTSDSVGCLSAAMHNNQIAEAKSVEISAASAITYQTKSWASSKLYRPIVNTYGVASMTTFIHFLYRNLLQFNVIISSARVSAACAVNSVTLTAWPPGQWHNKFGVYGVYRIQNKEKSFTWYKHVVIRILST